MNHLFGNNHHGKYPLEITEVLHSPQISSQCQMRRLLYGKYRRHLAAECLLHSVYNRLTGDYLYVQAAKVLLAHFPPMLFPKLKTVLAGAVVFFAVPYPSISHRSSEFRLPRSFGDCFRKPRLIYLSASSLSLFRFSARPPVTARAAATADHRSPPPPFRPKFPLDRNNRRQNGKIKRR